MGGTLRFRRRQQGFSLLEMMVAGAVMLTMTLGVASLIARHNKTISSQRTIFNRDDLKMMLDRTINNPVSYSYTIGLTPQDITLAFAGTFPAAVPAIAQAANSSAANTILYRCIVGDVANGCTGTAVGSAGGGAPTPSDFYMFSPEIGGALTRAVSAGGLTNAAAFFKVDGQRCTDAEATTGGNVVGSLMCPLKVVSQFSAVCPTTAPCTRAATITFSYTLSRVPEAIVAYTDVPAMKDISGVAVMDISRMGSSGQTACASPFVWNGVTCVNPLYVAAANPTQPAAQAQYSCAAGSYVTQVYSNGTVLCAPAAAPPSPDCATPKKLRYQGGAWVCADPLEGNSVVPIAPPAPGDQFAWGICAAGQVVTRVYSDGRIYCSSRPLGSNANGGTAGQDAAIRGKCTAGMTVSQVNNDGSVVCSGLTCNTTWASGWRYIGVAPLFADNFDGPVTISCAAGELLTGYSVRAVWDSGGGTCVITNPFVLGTEWQNPTGSAITVRVVNKDKVVGACWQPVYTCCKIQ